MQNIMGHVAATCILSLLLLGCDANLNRKQENEFYSVKVDGNQWTYVDPPPHELVAKMARYIVHACDWMAMSTISAREPIIGFPFSNIFSVSDGTVNHSTGIPYMYLTDMEMSMQDIEKDPRASVSMSLAQTDYCKKNRIDPEDPVCAHVILTGTLIKVTEPQEIKFARRALFSRHPEMKDWPKDHGWWFGKLNVTHICLLDYFGGVKHVDLEEYYQTDPEKISSLQTIGRN